MAITYKKRSCRFCDEKVLYIDFKETKTLTRFISEQGAIIPRRTSGTCSFHQHQLSLAIKRARVLALMPYASDIAR
jgi:small subunit ribosomal protein S18